MSNDLPYSANDSVTVSLPVYNCASTLRRAVDSILCQTHRNLLLVVVNDGGESPWHVLDDIDDARLVRFDLQENRGRYFADAVVLNAAASSYFAVQDADDWSEPNRLQMLLDRIRESNAPVAFSSIVQHGIVNGEPQRLHYPNLHDPLTPLLEHRVDHFGLFQTEQLRALGGCFGGFRVGYDTLLTNWILMAGRVAYVSAPLYHRQMRINSLTASPETGMASKIRTETTYHLRELYRRGYGYFVQHQTGKLDAADLQLHICRISQSFISKEAEAALRQESTRLRTRLIKLQPNGYSVGPVCRTGPERAGDDRVSASGETAQVPSGRRDLPSRIVTANNWAIPPNELACLEQALSELRPRRILEVGSGRSTIALAKFARQSGADVVSLEHDSGYHQQTMRMLSEVKLDETVDLKLAKLRPTACADGREYAWYDTDITGPFDFVLVDGPPQKHGRHAALFAIAPHLPAHWELWLHDAYREHEQICLELWRRHFRFVEQTQNGFAKLAGNQIESDSLEKYAPSLGVSILTGGRLPLLERTIASLRRHFPALLRDANVVLMINGADVATEDFVTSLDFVDRTIVHRVSVLPIGVAVSLLMQTLAGNPQVRWLLHLEDDWEATAGDPSWLAKGIRLLENDENIGQVRLRHTSERVLDRHMITGRPIDWRERDDVLHADHAHYTFNPSLIRRESVRDLCPCLSERDAQLQFLETGLATAQMRPGVFRHIGNDTSRRVALGR